MAGLGLALVGFIVLAVLGLVGDADGEVTLVFVQFLSQFAAGYVAGRLTGATPALDGGLAGLVVFFIAGTVSVAGGASLGIVVSVLLGAVAAVLGSAGGVLAEHLRRSS